MSDDKNDLPEEVPVKKTSGKRKKKRVRKLSKKRKKRGPIADPSSVDELETKEVEEWFASYTPESSRCMVCRLPESVVDSIKKYADLAVLAKESGERRRPLRAFHKMLQEKCRFPYTYETLRRHIRLCVLGLEP